MIPTSRGQATTRRSNPKVWRSGSCVARALERSDGLVPQAERCLSKAPLDDLAPSHDQVDLGAVLVKDAEIAQRVTVNGDQVG